MRTYPTPCLLSPWGRWPYGKNPNKVTIYGTSQAPYMDKVTLFHVFNRQIEIRTIAIPVRRRIRHEDHVLAGPGLCDPPARATGFR